MRAKAVVNAAGPWVDRVRRLEDPKARASMRLSKGVHVVVDGGDDWNAALTIPHDKVRVSFAVPWEGMLLLGTTDTEHDGEPETVAVTDDDVRQVLREASVAVDGLGEPRASYCGLRVLPGGDGATANAKRETVFSTGPSGMVSVAGGKLTTYRRIALDALDHLGVRGLSKRPRPLPGRDGPRPDRLAASSSTTRRGTICCTCTARSRRGARAGRGRSVAARAARARAARPARAGALRARARRVGARPTRTCSARADDALARGRSGATRNQAEAWLL